MNPESSAATDDGGPGRRPEDTAAFHSAERFRQRVFLGCCVAVALVKIWLVLAFGLRAAGNADADDRLFVVLAESILNGDWLGAYNRFTLAKGPFFSIWIAGVFLAHIPLTLSYQLFHIAACGLILTALKPRLPSRSGLFVLFVLLLLDPATYSAVASWVVRDGLYLPLTMAVLACMIALLMRLDRKPHNLIGWCTGLGLALAAFWTTREEGMWIVPGAGIALLYALVCVWRARQAPIAKTALLGLPVLLCVAGVLGICALNYRYYGYFGVVDIKSPGFKRANGALMRVHHEKWNQFANVPKEVRLKIYPASPAFAELQEFLEGPPGVAWGRGGEAWLDGGTPSPEDIRGGFFVWALRHAVQQRRYYRSAAEAEAFYTRIANEINAACSDGRLECGPERASLSPPWRREYVSLAARSFWKGVRMTILFDDVTVFNMPSGGPEDRMIIFEDLGRTRINPIMGDTTESPLRNQTRLDQFRFRQLNRLNSVYKAVAPYVTVVACVAFLLASVLEFRARTMSPALVIVALLLVSVAARMAILALISITSFEAMRLRYFLPLYPMLLLFWFLSIHHAASLVRSGSRVRSASPDTNAAEDR